MAKLRHVLFPLALGCCVLLSAEQQPESGLDKQVASVLPKAGEEQWLEIHWRTNLMKARAEAQLQGKPMFLWIMNGNPLGCT